MALYPLRCHLDYETRSELDLERVGLDLYSTSPTTEVILASYAFDDGPVNTWEPHVSSIPYDLLSALNSPDVLIHAFNAEFERVITEWVLGLSIPINRYRCTMAQARYLSLPGSLAECGRVLGLGEDERKLSEGSKLLRMFSLPTKLGGEETLFGISDTFYKDWDTHPREWQRFVEYNRQDVVSERAIHQRMKAFPIPDFEWDTYRIDQEVNDRGIYVDLSLVQGAVSLSEIIKKELTEKLFDLTKLENPNSRDQMLEWCRGNGYPYHALAKNFVNQALAGTEINDDCRKALLIRQQAAKTSDSKFYALSDRVGSDSRLRYSYAYMGAARTHRWSGHGVQTQNLVRPAAEVNKRLDETLELVRKVNYEGLKTFKTQPLDVLGSCIRSVFRAKPGHKLLICDLSAIENRVLGYICKADSILKVFRSWFCFKCSNISESEIPLSFCPNCRAEFSDKNRLDPYKWFGVDLFGKRYEDITKEERQDAKPAVLGGGYSLGPGQQIVTSEGDIAYTGLMKYARNMGIPLTQEVADRSIEVFRKKHWEVTQNWKDLDQAAKRCIKSGQPQTVNDIIRFSMMEDVLVATLPSGRSLHYLQPKIVTAERQGRDGPYTTEVVEYWGMNQEKHIFGRVFIYGGKFLENFDQSISRDLLVHGMKKAESIGLTSLVMHTHDELVYEVPISSPYGIKELRECMIDLPPWANKQLIVDAAGYEEEVYCKK